MVVVVRLSVMDVLWLNGARLGEVVIGHWYEVAYWLSNDMKIIDLGYHWQPVRSAILATAGLLVF